MQSSRHHSGDAFPVARSTARRWVFVLSLVSLPFATPALANSYLIVDLGEGTRATAINNKNAFLVEAPNVGAIARNGHRRLLPVGSGDYADPRGLNANGDVTGELGTGLSMVTGVWPRGQAFQAVAVPAGGTYSVSYGIAADGTVTGAYTDHRNYDDSRCFVTTPDGVTQDLGERDGGVLCVPSGINSMHQVAGFWEFSGNSFQAFVWQDGVYQDLGFLRGGQYSQATAINDRGQVVGVSQTTGGADHAFLWHGGVMKDLGALPDYGATQASAISSNGRIVGYATRSADSEDHAARFSDGQVYLLENEVVNLGQWTVLRYANGVNAEGVITGYGYIGNKLHGFLLQPQ